MLAVDRPAALATCTLDLEACCATARPADGGATFAVGTYTLVDQQRRTGVLYFFDAAAVCTTGLQVWPHAAPPHTGRQPDASVFRSLSRKCAPLASSTHGGDQETQLRWLAPTALSSCARRRALSRRLKSAVHLVRTQVPVCAPL